jgi:hypothetical protein
VGRGGANLRQDVKTVQALLNFNRRQIVPLPPLVVDGICGTNTIRAIEEFQHRALSLGRPDGRVDPGGATLARLVAAEPNTPITITGVPLPAPAEKVLKEVLLAAGLTLAKVTSVTRTPADQARIMYENIKQHGAAYNLRLYGPIGDKVIQVYVANHLKLKEADIIARMEAKIKELGPAKVSKHCSDTHYVLDVAPSSIANKGRFISAVSQHKAIMTFLQPPQDPAYHLEIPKDSPYL